MASRRRKRRRGRGRRRKGPVATYWPYILVVGLLVVAAVAWAATRPLKGGQQAVCVLVIDRTGSSAVPEAAARYKALASTAVDGCAAKHAKLSIYYFDNQSPKLVLVNDTPYDLFLPKARVEAKSGRKKALEQAKKDAKADVASVFDETSSGEARGSDILTAYQAAAANLVNQASADDVDQKYLIMLTDGIQTSADINFETFYASKNASVAKAIATAKANGLLPNLDGVQVSFVGVKGGADSSAEQLPEWFEAKVEDFWKGVSKDRLCAYVVDSQVIPVGC